MGKESACNERDAGDTGDMSLIPGSGRSPRGGNCNPLQYSCLKIPIDRGVWQATALSVGPEILLWIFLEKTICHRLHFKNCF